MYNHQTVEKKWQKIWKKTALYRTKEANNKTKYYILDMFPYPSGVGLHVGHPKGYIASDIFARHKLMQGYNVLHPMGFDAFGLPAENYALKNKTNPKIAVAESVKRFKKQLEILGFSYDWEREVNTTDPDYYKWTQWIFLQMFKHGLVFESDEPINWCPSCKTGLAQEDLEAGRCERCGGEIEQKPIRQWVLKITDYADRLLEDLNKLPAWEEPIKEMQRHWIGRSEGAEIIFKITNQAEVLKIFTTRVDTIFGCTYVVLAPEHDLVEKLKTKIDNWSEVEEYFTSLQNISEHERTSLQREKTGVLLKGIQAINPFNQEKVPVFIADYVLASYGTGAVMAVPAHDERDYDFAKKYALRIKPVIFSTKDDSYDGLGAFIEDGILKSSGEFDNLSSKEARKKMIAWLEKNNLGVGKVNYRLRDWVFSRQRYWGEPIPLIRCSMCGVVAVLETELPLKLPDVKSYEPTGTGESPLAAIDDWVNVPCPKCAKPAKRETNTMPQWAGSCWYYLRYIDPKNKKALVDKEKEKYWSPVDLYVGGAEHATRHLIYARFWHKFLFDIGVVSYEEPFTKFKHVGLIMGEDGRKMSKRYGNVVNPDKIVAQFGADSLRIYEMFMGPFEQDCNWSTNGLLGMRKFLEKILSLAKVKKYHDDKKIISLLHKTIKKVSADIEDFRFNTAISALMILINELTDYKNKNQALPVSQADFQSIIKLLAPFAPHLAEELWVKLGGQESVFLNSWPVYEAHRAKDDLINLVVQINGKLRAILEVTPDISEEEAFQISKEQENIKRLLEDKEVIKKIFIPGKLLNIVIK